MLSRRGFIISGVCATVSSTVYSAVPSGFKHLTIGDFFDVSEVLANYKPITYQHFANKKNTWLRFTNQTHAFDAKIVEIRDMNCDEQLEQFSVVLETRRSQINYSGTYRAYHESDGQLRSIDISLEKTSNDENNGRYITLYSILKST